MKYYKVMPKWKNSVFEFTNYENEDKTISFETEHQVGFRATLTGTLKKNF